MKYIPYIKYLMAKDTRFERDRKIFFDPEGEVARGLPLINYGWGPFGFKEMIEAFYVSKHGSKKGFGEYYEKCIKQHKGNIVSRLREAGLIDKTLPAFIRVTLKQDVAIPVLLVNIDAIFFKYCNECDQAFIKSGFPRNLSDQLYQLDLLEKFKQTFQCTRQICECLCDNYKNCVLNYTSTESKPNIEKKKEECSIELFKQIITPSRTSRYMCVLKQGVTSKNLASHIGKPRQRKRCLERNLRFNFTPLRYYFFDSKTWSKMEKSRYHTGFRHNFDMLPINVLPNFLRFEFLDTTGLVAPLNRKRILEHFLEISDVKFEIRYNLSKLCPTCKLTHQIIGIPIKAMFRDQDVYKHEANFGRLLWGKLWEKYPKEFCNSFQKRTTVSAEGSPVLKRDLKVRDVFPPSPFGLFEYDFAIDMSHLLPNTNQLLLFDLTTGLWKKSGFHEESRTSQQYLEIWRELLFRLPLERPNTVVVWYIVVNNTESAFFDETAPAQATNMNQLVQAIASSDPRLVRVVKTSSDISPTNINAYKLIVVPIFNTTQRKGEARVELRKLERKHFDQLLISRVVDSLMS